ncbi:MAG TPA: hypothetical protein VNH18_13945 [Bryobacteraceae bacterium]|nr:hypothetical protein [Bryobacteraceae bacterium]
MSEINTEENRGGESTSAAPRCMCGSTGPTLTRLIESLMPSGEACAHFRQAQVELLKGLRAVLDQCIDSASKPTHGTKLNVE